jgi:MerR family transcriptional regulator, copper efflux regulator
MREALTISRLARRSGVPPKTLRYWESLGLLPRAARTHTGYRLFDSESLRYIAFIRKSKSIGLTLAEMREVLRLARIGRCPCSKVVAWTEGKTKSLEKEVRSLSLLLHGLKRIRRQWSSDWKRGKCGNVCSLVAELPESRFFEGGKSDAKALVDSNCCRSDGSCGRGAGPGGRSKLLPAVLPVLPKVNRSKAAGSRT